MSYSPPNPNVYLTTLPAPVTGTITTSTSNVTLTSMTGVGSVAVTIYGTYTTVNISFQVYDGSNWLGISAYQYSNTTTPGALLATGNLSNATMMYYVTPILGMQQFRVQATNYGTGTANIIINPSAQFVEYAVGSVQTGGWNVGATIGSSPNAALADSTTNPTVNLIGGMNEVFNGTTWDRQRTNTTGVLVAAGATTTQTAVSLLTYNARSLVLIPNITTGTGSIVIAINGVSSSSYTWNILTSNSLSNGSTAQLRVFQGANNSANFVTNDVLPRSLSITVTVTGTITYGIDWVLGV